MKTQKGGLEQTDKKTVKTEKVEKVDAVVHEPKADEIVETLEALEKVAAKEETKAVKEVAPVEAEADTKVENGKKLKLNYKFNPVTRTKFPVWEEVESK